MTSKPFYILVDGNSGEYHLFKSHILAVSKAIELAGMTDDDLNDDTEEELMVGYDLTIQPIMLSDDF